MKANCEKLDAYLADDLHGEDAAMFAEHLANCGECRDAVAQQGWIDALLRAPASAAAESPPAAITESFRTSLAQRRRVRLVACGLATAAALLIALGWIELNRQAPRPAAPGTHDFSAIPVESMAAAEPSRATFITNGDTIAVPLESPGPDVTVVQLYPTTDTERRWRLELALQFAHPESNGG